MRVEIYQNCPVFGHVELNVEQTVKALSSVDADLLVLPELFNTGYQFVSREETADMAEEVPLGKTCQTMMRVARDRNVFLVFGLAERDGENIYNSAGIVGPRGFVGIYRKIHLFDEEKLFFDPGSTGFRVFDIGMARIVVMICFDWLLPESARVLALRGADIICHPANLVLPYCQKAMVTRSLENGVFTITANRIGTEARGSKGPLTFTGRSQIVDNRGIILTALDHNDRLGDRRPEF